MARQFYDSTVNIWAWYKTARHDCPPVTVSDEKLMFDIIRASFNQRRKTLVNGLGNAVGLDVKKEQVLSALEKMGLSSTIRGEALTLGEFAELTELLTKDRTNRTD